MLRIAIVDDHRIVRDGLEAVLGGHKDVTVVGTFSTGAALMEAFGGLDADIVVMDMRLPDGLGVDWSRRVKQSSSATKVLILTGFRSEAEIIMALEAGVDGYLFKDSSSRELLQAIHEISNGGFWASPEVMRRLRDAHFAASEPVTPREAEVLIALRDGLTTDEIGERLHLAPSTIKTHLAHIYRKLDARNRVEAVREAIQRGLVTEA